MDSQAVEEVAGSLVLDRENNGAANIFASQRDRLYKRPEGPKQKTLLQVRRLLDSKISWKV